MTTLVVGATGATGRLVVRLLLEQGEDVRAVARSEQKLIGQVGEHPGLTIVEASLLDLTDARITEILSDCSAVASCLGHNLSIGGMFGQPRRLVTDAARRLTEAIRARGNPQPTKYVLMNTAGNRNRGSTETVGALEATILFATRWLVPPQADNEKAAEYLRTVIGPEDPFIEWVVVRPDSLQDDPHVSPYTLQPSPTRSALFDPGSTSRINVADFIARLVVDEELWSGWKGQMPVVYGAASDS